MWSLDPGALFDVINIKYSLCHASLLHLSRLIVQHFVSSIPRVLVVFYSGSLRCLAIKGDPGGNECLSRVRGASYLLIVSLSKYELLRHLDTIVTGKNTTGLNYFLRDCSFIFYAGRGTKKRIKNEFILPFSL